MSESYGKDKSRVEREKRFHDQRFADDSQRKNKVGRFYKITQSIKTEYEKLLMDSCQGSYIIEYGCGTGSYAFALAKNGATKVTGIDISPVAIEIATTKAIDEGLGDNIAFEVMNAEELKFAHSSIDLICGSGILHHLELKKAILTIVDVLQPEGKAIFIEPLGHNILINLFRSLTPSIRSEDEHPLLKDDLKFFKTYFKKVEIKYFYLTSLIASLTVGFPIFRIVLSVLEFLDQILFKLPFLRNQAWQVLIVVSEPIK
ncbi:methyltransferase type 11 [Richelia sinica FACHB-800]|uniref:Methyltransferase type 11 n=1 Tax=Richelia sinica FACHB-800 TaxID=1357546 RepID=A0A975TAT4_9NOST|nr:class I SAM-dependent methyltransferase [Richelia sinica]MBD2664829.1 class I SAM-dependent methyltransferase [Richelia sinica FACHB-800]QXE25386.1 methyltransferase type 11 [Richelia sinica FACHB-800]